MTGPQPLRVADDADVLWRVHDCAYGCPPAAPGKRVRLALGDARATGRYFVNAAGVIRVHQFAKGESRDTEPETLARQLRSAAYLGRGAFDPATLRPDRRRRYVGPD